MKLLSTVGIRNEILGLKVATFIGEENMKSKIICKDVMNVFSELDKKSAQIIIADPPYNIGKDFGNNSTNMGMKKYLKWCKGWIDESLELLMDNGTMFIYGFSEILAHILTILPEKTNCRWVVWHYTNKNVASLHFWQRSHESILVIWKKDRVFNRDDVREPYTEGFLKNAAGKTRKATKGRFSSGKKETVYNAHQGGALPRDVIKISALAGGAGAYERVRYCEKCEVTLHGQEWKLCDEKKHSIINHDTQKPIALCEKLIKSCLQEDGYLFVPFAGTGSECVAAKKLGVPYIGIEMNPDYVKMINSRLERKS